jgi:hypothetical protein
MESNNVKETRNSEVLFDLETHFMDEKLLRTVFEPYAPNFHVKLQ